MTSHIGLQKSELDTPALLLDLDDFEKNLVRMQSYLDEHSVSLRPHFKAHRTPDITRRQIERGAKGVTCAKLGEAEHLASLGFDNLLVANQVAGDIKLKRLAELSKTTEVIVAVDSEELVDATDVAARENGTTIDLIIEVDLGMSRCGVTPFEPTVSLAKTITDKHHLRFRGLMGYEGHLVDLPPGGKKDSQIRSTVELLTGTAEQLKQENIPVEIVSSGGTGSYHVTATCPGVTELQCGSYFVGDTMFSNCGADFEPAGSILGTVVSCPETDRVVTDCGMKTLQSQFGMPVMRSHPGWELQPLSAEHGQLKRVGDGADIKIADRIEFDIFYCDGNINLHEQWFCMRNERVEDVWEISGRGKSQ